MDTVCGTLLVAANGGVYREVSFQVINDLLISHKG
jgi:hypothetical protein